MSANCLLERGCEEWGSVEDPSLGILPFVLRAEGEAGIRRLGVPLSNNAEGLHHHNPILHQLCQPQLLLIGAPNKATKVALPP